MTKRLVEERGFTAVVFEADWPFMEGVNEYAQGRRASPWPSGGPRFPAWMWQNQCMAEFFAWCKAQPSAGTPGLFGMDCYSLFESKRALLAFLEAHDKEFHAEVSSKLAYLDRFEDGFAYGDAMVHGNLSRVAGHIADVLTTIQSRLQWGSGAYAGATDGERLSAEQNCEVVIAADEYYRKCVSEPAGSQASWNARDQHMTTTLLRMQDRLGDPKIVVWAHNRSAPCNTSPLCTAHCTSGANTTVRINRILKATPKFLFLPVLLDPSPSSLFSLLLFQPRGRLDSDDARRGLLRAQRDLEPGADGARDVRAGARRRR